MEARKIFIVCTKDQSKHVVTTDAETLGQLKAALDNNHIDYTNMAFLEGRTKTELKSDDSPLPKDVVLSDGTTTNELVFMLTNMKKKIESGVDRAEVYVFIRNTPGVAEAIREHFGCPYTNVSTADLDAFLSAQNEEPAAPCRFQQTLDELYDDHQMTTEAYQELSEMVAGCSACCVKENFPSDSELQQMFGNIA